ncbi:uncharacterized protein LOC109255987 [Panthera pardus]|uniref:Uncharacterized protein LOC109255987 n=1 Tax=Panthera pardus TaxID=9691 RepID=A0A9V1EQR0_PANPR|nr:uncharacterized protein LOC109255987 [Panthera pardus]
MGLCKSKLPHKGRALRSRRRGIITDLISNTMLLCQESCAFLTDGFPWKLKQAKELERILQNSLPGIHQSQPLRIKRLQEV